MRVAQNSFPSSPEAHSRQSRYSVLAWGNCNDCHCSRLVMRLHHAWVLFFMLVLVEVQDLRLAEFSEVLIELRNCFQSFPELMTVQCFDCLSNNLIIRNIWSLSF
jgi:hypothetical protein